MKAGIILILIFMLSACSSIQRSSQLEDANLAIGIDSKSSVVEKIGLPNKIKKSGAKEYWLYSGNGTNHSVVIVTPLGASMVANGQANASDVAQEITSSHDIDSHIDLVCVFNQKKLLVHAYKPGNKRN